LGRGENGKAAGKKLTCRRKRKKGTNMKNIVFTF